MEQQCTTRCGKTKYTGKFASSHFCIKSSRNVHIAQFSTMDPKYLGHTTTKGVISNQTTQAFPTIIFALCAGSSFCSFTRLPVTLTCYSSLTFHARYFLFSTLYLFHSLMTARSTCSETGRKNGEYTAKQCSNE